MLNNSSTAVTSAVEMLVACCQLSFAESKNHCILNFSIGLHLHHGNECSVKQKQNYK